MSRLWLMGLTTSQAKQRKEIYGLNEIVKDNRFKWIKLLWSLWSTPLIWLFSLTAVLTAIVGNIKDAVLIMTTVVLNTIIGFIQEFRVEKSLISFKNVLAARVEVFRDGERETISASEIVPGDIIFVSNKHRIAADGIIISNESLHTVEAELTGESEAVEKQVWEKTEEVVDIELALSGLRDEYDKIDNVNKVFMGTLVKAGVAKVLVIKTGMETEVGKIAGKIKEEKEPLTPLQIKIGGLTKTLAIMVILVTSLLVVHSWLVHEEIKTVFPLAVALTAAALPEGLIVSFTMVLAIGMQRILKRGGIVKHLASAETLGSVQVICCDKTGTLTEGVMKVTQAVTNLKGESTGEGNEKIIMAAILCNDLRDPLEISMNEWANEQIKKLKGKIQVDSYERIDSLPFNSQEKLIMTLFKVENKDHNFLISGAPEVVLDKTNLSEKDKEEWRKKMTQLASQGFRLVGFAGKAINSKDSKRTINKNQDVKNMEWQGVLVYEDPVREGVKSALEKVRQSGIEIKVITGDYKETAMAIIRQLGMDIGDDQVMVGEELAQLTQEELVKKIEKIILFARTNPQQKLRIVEAIKSRGLIVAMTGDGTNDAPAIKKADIGIVMNDSTEIAKETSDLVLTRNSFETIVGSIEEGRSILNNFKKVLVYLLSGAFTAVLVVVGSIVLDWPIPLLVSQILWVHLISEGFPYLALTIEPKEDNLLTLRPEVFGGRLLSLKSLLIIMTISITTAVMSLSVFGWYYFGLAKGLVYAQTMTMCVLGVSALVYIFSTRSLEQSILVKKLGKNNWLLVGVFLGWMMILAAIYYPPMQKIIGTISLNIDDWSLILSTTLVVLISSEMMKLILANFLKSKKVV